MKYKETFGRECSEDYQKKLIEVAKAMEQRALDIKQTVESQVSGEKNPEIKQQRMESTMTLATHIERNERLEAIRQGES